MIEIRSHALSVLLALGSAGCQVSNGRNFATSPSGGTPLGTSINNTGGDDTAVGDSGSETGGQDTAVGDDCTVGTWDTALSLYGSGYEVGDQAFNLAGVNYSNTSGWQLYDHAGTAILMMVGDDTEESADHIAAVAGVDAANEACLVSVFLVRYDSDWTIATSHDALNYTANYGFDVVYLDGGDGVVNAWSGWEMPKLLLIGTDMVISNAWGPDDEVSADIVQAAFDAL